MLMAAQVLALLKLLLILTLFVLSQATVRFVPALQLNGVLPLLLLVIPTLIYGALAQLHNVLLFQLQVHVQLRLLTSMVAIATAAKHLLSMRFQPVLLQVTYSIARE